MAQLALPSGEGGAGAATAAVGGGGGGGGGQQRRGVMLESRAAMAALVRSEEARARESQRTVELQQR